MRILLTVFLFSIFGAVFLACDGGSGDGGSFAPTGDILAVAERSGNNQLIKVGGTEGSVPPGSTVEVTNLNTGETQTTMGLPDGSFDPTFMGDTNDIFNVLVTRPNGVVEEDTVIGVTLLRNAVQRNLAQLGSVPADIQIRGERLYVVNGFSNNIQIFDISQSSPQEIGTITIPPNSNPIGMAFLNDTIAYVTNNSGQSVAVVNVETRQCETIFVSSEDMGITTPCSSVINVPSNTFEEPVGVIIVNGKVYISNNNLDPFFSPNGNGFITIIDPVLNQITGFIDATGANTSSMITIGNTLYAMNNGNILFDLETFEFSCDANFPPSIDLINLLTDSVIDTIEIPLSQINANVCLPNSLTADSEGYGYSGLGLVGALLKFDLIERTVINGTDNPIIITDLSGLNFTSGIAIRDDLLFTTLFNSDQMAVLDTNNDQVNPFPYIAPLPLGIRADDPDSDLLEGAQGLVIRPGIKGVDFQGPDIYYMNAIFGAESLGSVNSDLQP